MLASLDNWKAIDGRTISWALLDETKDTPEAAVKEVIISRLRKIGLCRVRDDVSFERLHSGSAMSPMPMPVIRSTR